jgi:5-(carboxyamino)imidazole ribonucleotide synthase
MPVKKNPEPLSTQQPDILSIFAAMKPCYDSQFQLGILGGGQLGRMLLQEAINLDVRMSFLDPDQQAPCHSIGHHFTHGDFNDFDTVLSFGENKDLITIEIEHVNTEALFALQKKGVKVFPQPEVISMIQDKGLQKQFYADHHLPTAAFELVDNADAVRARSDRFPMVQKLRKGGYDGRGVQVLRSEADFEHIFDAPSVLETLVDFEQEISVITARNESGEIKCFPAVGMEFNAEANLVEFLFAPADISPELETRAQELATRLTDALGIIGLLAVEMFVTRNGELLINEMAPRPHNSGHHTIEANYTSQYAQHLRAILNLPLGHTALRQPAVMLNLLGEKGYTGPVHYENLDKVLAIPGAHVHLYGKKTTKPFRKMGHVTVVDDTLESAKNKAKEIQQMLRVVTKQFGSA